VFVFLTIGFNPGGFCMADPNVHSSLNVFLNYDFDHQIDHANRLGVAKREDGTSYLVSLSKTDKQALKEIKASLSLKKVVEFILNHQNIWLQEIKDQRPKLEYQLAWLERKVQERNQAPLKRDINYQNPARLTLNIKIVFPKAFNEEQQKQILTKEWTQQYTFDRLATQKNIYKLCNQAIKGNFVLKMTCSSENCKNTHKIRIIATQLFKKFSLLGDSPTKDSHELFFPIEKEGNEATLSIEASQGQESLLSKLVKALHESAKATNNSSNSKSTPIYDASYLLAASSDNHHHSSSSSHHHSCGSSGGHHHSCGGHHHHSCGGGGGFSSCGGHHH
jgi:hypothetical protein